MCILIYIHTYIHIIYMCKYACTYVYSIDVYMYFCDMYI